MKNKSSDWEKIAGMLIIIASIELVAFILIAQHLYPNYSLANNYISDLGVGSTAPIFNSAVSLFGLIIIAASALIWKGGRHRYAAIMFFLSGIGGLGVGLFPETTGIYHLAFAGLVFGGVAVNAIIFYRIFNGRLAYYSLIVGLIAIFILFLSPLLNINLGLGHGGAEELLFYEEIIWVCVVGICFISKKI